VSATGDTGTTGNNAQITPVTVQVCSLSLLSWPCLASWHRAKHLLTTRAWR
jgi:hypothetical protein